MDQQPQSPTVSSTTESQKPKPKRTLRIVLVVAIILVAVSAIGVSAYVLMNPSGLQTPANEKSGAVTITERGVAPATVTIKKGDSVTWTNQDKAAHRLVLTTPNLPQEVEGFGSDEPLATGETYSFIFEVSGTYTYEDPENPGVVQGTVVVEDN